MEPAPVRNLCLFLRVTGPPPTPRSYVGSLRLPPRRRLRLQALRLRRQSGRLRPPPLRRLAALLAAEGRLDPHGGLARTEGQRPKAKGQRVQPQNGGRWQDLGDGNGYESVFNWLDSLVETLFTWGLCLPILSQRGFAFKQNVQIGSPSKLPSNTLHLALRRGLARNSNSSSQNPLEGVESSKRRKKDKKGKTDNKPPRLSAALQRREKAPARPNAPQRLLQPHCCSATVAHADVGLSLSEGCHRQMLAKTSRPTSTPSMWT